MSQLRRSGHAPGAVESALSSLTRSGPAEQNSSRPPTVETRTTDSSAASGAFTRLRDRFAGYRRAESRALVRVCTAAAYASALRVPRWMAQSQRDYSSALLGVHHSTFCQWVRVGRLLCARPELAEDSRKGLFSLSELDQIARRGLAELVDRGKSRQAGNQGGSRGGGQGSDKTGDQGGSQGTRPNSERTTTAPSLVSLSITGPAPAILYIEESLELARAMVGASASDEDAVAALIAEASTESGQRVPHAEARRRFRVRDPRRARSTATGSQPLPHPSLPALGHAAQRRAALRLHAILLRLIARRDRLRVRQEDQLHEWMLDGLHERCGYRNFERFAREVLDLATSTCTDRLRRARERRREHPIAIARRDGVLSVVQADLLHRLHRRCHVPRSDLAGWIRYAQQGTVRRLRAAIDWAKRQLHTDYRSWCLAGCPPPDTDQLRTNNRSLEGLMKESRAEELAQALILWEGAALGTARLCISTETRDELLVEMASMQDEVRGGAPRRIPGWLALCRAFHRARESWRIHHQTVPAAQRRILDRDGWQCAAPECTQRKNLQVHHLKYRSRGGDDRDSNRVTLCAFHHTHGEHGGLMRVRGTIQQNRTGLTWEMGLDEHGRAVHVYRDEQLLERA